MITRVVMIDYHTSYMMMIMEDGWLIIVIDWLWWWPWLVIILMIIIDDVDDWFMIIDDDRRWGWIGPGLITDNHGWWFVDADACHNFDDNDSGDNTYDWFMIDGWCQWLLNFLDWWSRFITDGEDWLITIGGNWLNISPMMTNKLWRMTDDHTNWLWWSRLLITMIADLSYY